jgi:hypothetical protein
VRHTRRNATEHGAGKKAGTLFRSTGIQSGEFWTTPV